MSPIVEAIVTIALAVIGLAIVSVLVSNKANTTGVVQSLGSAFGNSLGVAESPVTGASATLNLSYPTSNAYGFGSSQ